MNLRPPGIAAPPRCSTAYCADKSDIVNGPADDINRSQAALFTSNHSTASTGTVAGSVVTNAQIRPPPPLTRWSARLVFRAQAPDQPFLVRVRSCRFSGPFIGTYSPVPYAAPSRVAPRTRPVGCAFAVESSVGAPLHGQHQACPGQVPYLTHLGHSPLSVATCRVWTPCIGAQGVGAVLRSLWFPRIEMLWGGSDLH